MSEISSFYYNEQLKNYIAQFMAIFAGIQVQVGWTGETEPRLISVPIAHGSKDRIAADVKAENASGNKIMRLPMFSAHMNSIDLAPELRKGLGAERRSTFMRRGGLFPDDFQVVHQLMPVPYWATMELGIYTSNMDQQFQIMEQILTLFDPILQVQTSEEVYDWTKIVTVELIDIGNEENFPAAEDRRILQTTLGFRFQMYLSAPASIRQDFIKELNVRLGIIATHDCSLRPHTWSSRVILDELDAGDSWVFKLYSADDFTEESLNGPVEEESKCDE